MEGYCMKCKKKMVMKNTIASKTKRGTPMTKGVCNKCGCKMCRIGK